MSDIFRRIFTDVVLGFRDSVLGAVKIIKYRESSQSEPTASKAPVWSKTHKAHQAKEKQDREPSILQRTWQCGGLNGGVFLCSILLFNWLLMPSIKWILLLIFGDQESQPAVWHWTGMVLSWTFNALWILPLFVLSKVVNCFWFQDIADAAYIKRRGKPRLPNLSVLIADMLFSVTLQALFLIQATLVSYLPIPVVGNLLSLLHLCLLYALYAFEYKWFNMGLEVHKRLSSIENNWPYYCGFGLPLALCTSLPSSHVIGGCIFSILFPLFIISANEATEPSPNFEFPLKLFAPVVTISNWLFHHSLKKNKNKQTEAQKKR